MDFNLIAKAQVLHHNQQTAGVSRSAQMVFRFKKADGDRAWREYLRSVSDAERQGHNCNACRESVKFLATTMVAIRKGAGVGYGSTAPQVFKAPYKEASDAKIAMDAAFMVARDRLAVIAEHIEPVYSAQGATRWLGVNDGFKHIEVPSIGCTSVDMTSAWVQTCTRLSKLLMLKCQDGDAAVSKAWQITNAAGNAGYRVSKAVQAYSDLRNWVYPLNSRGLSAVAAAHAIARDWGTFSRNSLASEFIEKVAELSADKALAWLKEQSDPKKYLRKTAPLSLGQVKVLANSQDYEDLTKALRRIPTPFDKLKKVWVCDETARAAKVVAGGLVLNVKAAKTRDSVQTLSMAPNQFAKWLLVSSIRELKITPLRSKRVMLTSCSDTSATPIFRWGTNEGYYMMDCQPSTTPQKISLIVRSPAYSEGSTDPQANILFATWMSGEKLRHSGVFEEVVSHDFKKFGRIIEQASVQQKLFTNSPAHYAFGIALNELGADYTAIVKTAEGSFFINVK